MWNEAVKEAELHELMEKNGNKLSMFHERNKMSGMSAMERASYAIEQCLLLRAFGAWKLDSTMENGNRSCHDKIEAKRQQLVGVQQMFRNFATQLESGLKASQAETTNDARGL